MKYSIGYGDRRNSVEPAVASRFAKRNTELGIN